MNKLQTVTTFLFIAIYIWVECSLFLPTTVYGTTIPINVSAGDTITITGADTVSVSAEDDGYFRIYSGDNRLLAEPNEMDVFTASNDSFTSKNWQIKEGNYVDVTIASTSLIVVRQVLDPYFIFINSFLILLLFFVFWIMFLLIME